MHSATWGILQYWALHTNDVVLWAEGVRLDTIFVALEAFDDDTFDVHSTCLGWGGARSSKLAPFPSYSM